MLPKFNRCFATPVRDPIGSKNVGLNCVWFWVRSAPAARWREVEVDAAARARGWRVGELEWTRNPATSQSKYQRRIIRISLIIFVGGVEWILSLLPCSGWYVSHSSAPPAWPGNRGGTRLENRKKTFSVPFCFSPAVCGVEGPTWRSTPTTTTTPSWPASSSARGRTPASTSTPGTGERGSLSHHTSGHTQQSTWISAFTQFNN